MRIGSISVRTKAILIQALIILGLIVWFKLVLPIIQNERAADELARHEQKIESLVQSMVVDAAGPETDAPAKHGAKPARPKRLRFTASVEDIQRALGAPDTSMTDFRGGQHLTWIGTRHKLEASFNKGRLYALALVDLQTGHGMTVFEWSAQWQQF